MHKAEREMSEAGRGMAEAERGSRAGDHISSSSSYLVLELDISQPFVNTHVFYSDLELELTSRPHISSSSSYPIQNTKDEFVYPRSPLFQSLTLPPDQENRVAKRWPNRPSSQLIGQPASRASQPASHSSRQPGQLAKQASEQPSQRSQPACQPALSSSVFLIRRV
jgi:hypothetical protein